MMKLTVLRELFSYYNLTMTEFYRKLLSHRYYHTADWCHQRSNISRILNTIPNNNLTLAEVTSRYNKFPFPSKCDMIIPYSFFFFFFLHRQVTLFVKVIWCAIKENLCPDKHLFLSKPFDSHLRFTLINELQKLIVSAVSFRSKSIRCYMDVS